MVRALLWAALLQGGMPGAERLRDSAPLIKLLQDQKRSGRLYAAICAAPAVVFEPNGLLEGKAATSHPAFVDGLSDTRCALDHMWIHQNIVFKHHSNLAWHIVSMSAAARDIAHVCIMSSHVPMLPALDPRGACDLQY
jgi:DJ-1/PfpI family